MSPVSQHDSLAFLLTHSLTHGLAGFPDEAERLDILHAVGKDMELDAEALAYLPDIAAAPKSAHFSGADLQAVMYSAQLELVHEKLKSGGEHSKYDDADNSVVSCRIS